MKQLTEYKKHGYNFSIIHREGDLAIAKGERKDSQFDNWEVFFIQKHNGLMMGANWVDAAEFCPSNSTWGIKGWTAYDEADARRIFKREKEKSGLSKSN
jgi:hypothetical protein